MYLFSGAFHISFSVKTEGSYTFFLLEVKNNFKYIVVTLLLLAISINIREEWEEKQKKNEK